MSISGQNLSVVIVTLKSEKVIHNCIKSINQNLPIIVVENSNNQEFKENLENKYNNLKCILSKSNLGMGAGNNIGIKASNTEYVLILNPDVILEKNTIEEIFFATKSLSNFTILAPLEKKFANYGSFNKKKLSKDVDESPFEVDFVDGFAMLLNKKKINEIDYFDENFFMYLENDDLCKRVKDKGGSIYVIPKSKIDHLAASTVDKKFEDEVEFSRNWHWIWSKFYFNKKHFNFFKAFYKGFPGYFTSILKFLFYKVVNNKKKKIIYLNRASGFYNALLGKASWYRPNLDN
jgi:N-acetylglucosaminyl-diphospho-decaprenol L-rhamnosyltransferase